MKVLYVRISSVDQRSDRQRVNENEFDLIVEDKCSGSIPLFERQEGKKLLELIEKDIEFTLHVYSIDRLGRNLKDLVNTIHFLKKKGIGIHFISQGLKTIDDNGKENPIRLKSYGGRKRAQWASPTLTCPIHEDCCCGSSHGRSDPADEVARAAAALEKTTARRRLMIPGTSLACRILPRSDYNRSN